MVETAKTKRKAKQARGTGGLHVYQALRDEILQLKVKPGSALDEMGLSERFGLSRSPVREALIRLSGEGLVEILPNRSTIVAPIDVQKMPNYLDALDMMQRITHRLAALQRDDDDLTAIKSMQMSFEHAVDEAFKVDVSLPIIDSNYNFHMAVAQPRRTPISKASTGVCWMRAGACCICISSISARTGNIQQTSPRTISN